MAFVNSQPKSLALRSTTQRKAVQVTAVRYHYYPQRFEWRGAVYIVDAVEQCWSESKSTMPWSVKRHYFWVRTQQKRFLLVHDVESGRWTCEKQVK